MDPLTLQKEVSDKYDLITITPGTYDFAGFGKIDLTTLTVAQADSLVTRKFPFLVAKAPVLGADVKGKFIAPPPPPVIP